MSFMICDDFYININKIKLISDKQFSETILIIENLLKNKSLITRKYLPLQPILKNKWKTFSK